MKQFSQWVKHRWRLLTAILAAGLILAGTAIFVQPILFPANDSANTELSQEDQLRWNVSNDPIFSGSLTAEIEGLEEREQPKTEPKKSTLVIPTVRHMKYSKVWNPPDEGQYFWQIVDPKMGYPEKGGTDYVLAHACESQECAGDNIRKLEKGNTLTYKGEKYTVQDKTQVMKTDIPSLNIWEHDPDRLIIITCIIETTWWASDKNDIIIATKAP